MLKMFPWKAVFIRQSPRAKAFTGGRRATKPDGKGKANLFEQLREKWHSLRIGAGTAAQNRPILREKWHCLFATIGQTSLTAIAVGRRWSRFGDGLLRAFFTGTVQALQHSGWPVVIKVSAFLT
jgi:hypothetical protein